MAQPSCRPVTYEDLLALPDHVVGEIVDGELYVSPRPRLGHASAAIALAALLVPPFRQGVSGPGGWIILPEPEVHVLTDVVVPDLAGWRRERMPELVLDAPWSSVAPDWVCEILSPSTVKLDRGRKLAVYARERVPHVWFVDPAERHLEVLQLDGATYRTLLSVTGAVTVRAAPFSAIELALAALWLR